MQRKWKKIISNGVIGEGKTWQNDKSDVWGMGKEKRENKLNSMGEEENMRLEK